MCNLDVETGECVGDESDHELKAKQSTSRKTKFNIPKSYLKQSEAKPAKDKCYLSTQETFTLTSKERVIELKEVNCMVVVFAPCNNQNFEIPENHSRLQQNQSSSVFDSIAFYFPTHRRNQHHDNRNYTSRLEPQKKHKKR
jgi:hypothetical protein